MNLIKRNNEPQEAKTLDAVIAVLNGALAAADAIWRRARLCYVHRVEAEWRRQTKGLVDVPVDERMLRSDWEMGLLVWWLKGSIKAIVARIAAREQGIEDLSDVERASIAESERCFRELEDARKRFDEANRIVVLAGHRKRIENIKLSQDRDELETFLARDHAVRQGVKPDLWRVPDPAHEPKRQQPHLAIDLDVVGYIESNVSKSEAQAICRKHNNEAIKRAEAEWSKVHRAYELQLSPDDINLLDSGEVPREAA